MSEETKGFEPKGTKISPAMAKVWDAVCEALGTNTYDLIQQFIYAMIRMSGTAHKLTPEVQKLMCLLDTDVAWQKAINLCAPEGKQTIQAYGMQAQIDENIKFLADMRPIDFALNMLTINIISGFILGVPIAAIMQRQGKTEN